MRCPYHGWKFDVNGQCVDVPSEPAESGYANKIKVTSYPVIEQGGVIWTYMGKAENMPPKPNYEFSIVPKEQSFTSKRLQECNWLQALEGGIDSSHVSWLHRGDVKADPLFKDAGGNKYNLNDLAPVFEVIESEGGLYIGARRMAEDNQYYWRITPWLMPCYTAVPPRGDYPMHGHFWVPIDDHNCWAWSFDYHPVRALTRDEVNHMKAGKGVHCKYVPGTYRPLANKDNDYLMDREAQRVGTTYSGIEGIAIQDSSLQESMGPIIDRTKENLVGCDNGIIMMRHKIMRAAKALREKGTLPPAARRNSRRFAPRRFFSSATSTSRRARRKRSRRRRACRRLRCDLLRSRFPPDNCTAAAMRRSFFGQLTKRFVAALRTVAPMAPMLSRGAPCRTTKQSKKTPARVPSDCWGYSSASSPSR